MNTIYLTHSKETIIDSNDYETVAKFRWYATKKYKIWYAARTARKNGRRITEFLHRFLLNAKKGQCVDHINGNGLDNRQSNLRLCSVKQNQHNRKKYMSASSEYKGVCKRRRIKSWVFSAQILTNGKQRRIGCFKNEIDAAIAYDIEAVKCFGKYARLNFPIIRRIK